MTQSYCLDEDLGSAAAPPIASDLLALRGQEVRVDGARVRFAGALSLQVLVAARRQWEADGCAFAIAPISEDLAQAAAGLGIDLASIGAAPEDIVEKEAAS